MPALLRIDQVGLGLGTPGVSRSDGLATGALVTLTNLGGGTTVKVNLLWVPPEDTTAEGSLTQTGPNAFTFSPTPLVYGTYRIELIVDDGLPTKSITRHTFGIRTPTKQLLIPAANELANPTSTLQNDTDAARLEASETNEPFAPFIGRQPFGWWKSLRDLYMAVETGGGGGGAVIPFANVLYVDPTVGNDGTGVRGDLSHPYATIQGAINAMQNADVIMLAPTTHTVLFSLFYPVGITDLFILGAGSDQCFVNWNNFIGDMIAPPPTAFGFALHGVTTRSFNRTQNIVNANGSGSGGFYMSDRFSMRDVRISRGSLSFDFVSALDIQDVSLEDGDWTLNTCSSGFAANNEQPMRDVFVSGFVGVSWNALSADQPNGARPFFALRFQRWIVGGIIYLRNEPKVYFDDDCDCQQVTTDSGLTANGGLGPSIDYHGIIETFEQWIGTSGTAFPDTPNGKRFNFDRVKIRGASFLGAAFEIEVAPGGVPVANRLSASCRDAQMATGGAPSVQHVFARWGVDLEGRGGSPNADYASYPGSDGTIAPPSVQFDFPLAAGAGPQGVVFPGNITPGTPAPRSVSANIYRAIGGVTAITNPTVSAISTFGFSLNYSGASDGADSVRVTAFF